MSAGNILLLPHGGYRKLRSYAVAEAVYADLRGLVRGLGGIRGLGVTRTWGQTFISH